MDDFSTTSCQVKIFIGLLVGAIVSVAIEFVDVGSEIVRFLNEKQCPIRRSESHHGRYNPTFFFGHDLVELQVRQFPVDANHFGPLQRVVSHCIPLQEQVWNNTNPILGCGAFVCYFGLDNHWVANWGEL
jgi:hypothetical protein